MQNEGLEIMSTIKYVHTNLITSDWRALADFYIEVFGCKPVYPERDLHGAWLDKLTTLKDAAIRGIHLRLPGYDDGPTLEIFEYSPKAKKTDAKQINDAGFGHIAFLVDSVDEVLDRLIKAGGSALGEIIRRDYEGLGTLTVVYTRDLDGNFIEIQNWSD